MGLTRTIVNLKVKNQKIESFNNYLFIGPHPDDIEIGCGQTISKLVSLNKKITFLICTDGRYGKDILKDAVSSDELINIRKNEAIKAANYLGVNDIQFLGLEDGNNYDYQELLRGIAGVINNIKPDVIFATDPDVTSECHKDHLNIGNAAKEIAYFANYKDIFSKYITDNNVNDINIEAICFYMSNKNNKIVRSNKKFFNKQINSIKIHSSQYPENNDQTNTLKLYLRIRSFEYGLKKCSFYGEGFRMINRTRMHCLPEASK